LYDYTVAAVKAACPEARVGGPATTNPNPGGRAGEFLGAFLDHCANGANQHSGERGAALDFITFHVKGGGDRADPQHRPAAPASPRRDIVSSANTRRSKISNACRRRSPPTAGRRAAPGTTAT